MNFKFLICTVAVLVALVALVTADGENGEKGIPKNRMGGHSGGKGRKPVWMMSCLLAKDSSDPAQRQNALDFEQKVEDAMNPCGFGMFNKNKTEGRNLSMTSSSTSTSRNMSDERVRGEHMKGQGSGATNMIFTDEQKRKFHNKKMCVMGKAGITSEDNTKFNMDVVKEWVGKVVKTEAQPSFLNEMKNCTTTKGMTESSVMTLDDVQMKSMVECFMSSAWTACKSIQRSKPSTNNDEDTNDENKNPADQ